MITPSDSQAAAIKAIIEWYCDPNGKQVFYLAGYAGTGKSTVYRFVREGLADHGATNIVTCAYTGKAANVLRQKGTYGAMTIHAAIYIPIEDPATGKVTFVKNVLGPAAGADLIGLDECSMVDDEMADDLLSFGKRVLVMGDPGQLPPVKGPGAFTAGKPDVFLTEIHRQAAESPIIRIATMARCGTAIPFGDYGDSVLVSALNARTGDLVYGEGTQTICGVHRVRSTITHRYRERLGYGGRRPLPGERIICRKNDKALGIFNGGLGIALQVKESLSGMLKLSADMEDLDAPIKNVLTSPHHFESHWEKMDRPRGVKGLQDFDWAYALTCHSAQGSEWPHVTVVDDSGVFREDSAKWLYTAITRAAEGVTLLRRVN